MENSECNCLWNDWLLCGRNVWKGLPATCHVGSPALGGRQTSVPIFGDGSSTEAMCLICFGIHMHGSGVVPMLPSLYRVFSQPPRLCGVWHTSQQHLFGMVALLNRTYELHGTEQMSVMSERERVCLYSHGARVYLPSEGMKAEVASVSRYGSLWELARMFCCHGRRKTRSSVRGWCPIMTVEEWRQSMPGRGGYGTRRPGYPGSKRSLFCTIHDQEWAMVNHISPLLIHRWYRSTIRAYGLL